MKFQTKDRLMDIANQGNYGPSVSVFLAFDPKMSSKSEISLTIEKAVESAKEQMSTYAADISSLVIHKLKQCIQHLNYSTNKKSIALFVSAFFEKVLYLDLPLENKVIVGNSFRIKDLVLSKKVTEKYLLLSLHNSSFQMYVGDAEGMQCIVSDSFLAEKTTCQNGKEAENTNCCGACAGKTAQHVDASVGIILSAYHLPLFVTGSALNCELFRHRTRHGWAVVEYFEREDATNSPDTILHSLQPMLLDWQKVREIELTQRLAQAASSHKLSLGLDEVSLASTHHPVSLLIIERGFTGPADNDYQNGMEGYRAFTNIKDRIDEIIERVLEQGGDVEFVTKGLLPANNHIALIENI